MFSGYTSAEVGGWASAFPEIVSAVLSPTRILIFLNWTVALQLCLQCLNLSLHLG